MRGWLATGAAVALISATVHADVRITQTVTMEGAAAGLAGGMMPTIVTSIKGLKGRLDVNGGNQTLVAITDAEAKRVMVLNPSDETATLVQPGAPTGSETPPQPLPKLEVLFKPTGATRTVDGYACQEYSLGAGMSLAELGAQIPPAALEMLKDVRMNVTGSVWIATSGPGLADYVAFHRAAEEAGLTSMISQSVPVMNASGLDRLLAGPAGAPGLPYQSELNVTIEGSGPIVDAMKQMGGMKIVMKVTGVSADALPADLFVVPEHYKTAK